MALDNAALAEAVMRLIHYTPSFMVERRCILAAVVERLCPGMLTSVEEPPA